MSQPTFAVAVHFYIEPEYADQFHVVIRRQAANSLSKEAGCHQFDVCFDKEDPSKVFLYETYSDAAAFEAHRQTDHFAEFSAAIEGWVADKQASTWTIDRSDDR